MVPLVVLASNLWFAATRLGASSRQIFSVAPYWQEYLQATARLPFALQSLTWLREITERLNRSASEILENAT